ncbi:hypothetical protein [Catenovulum adriaticum]|uniref:Uncharacterized protein n=1 Tax=Catenovulum adriaticum TaxID=2984846 RepID=A0ABY7AL44_9ALTE|nr:hypothetical protein [Catenovulum sp. TS8]WAJ69376.1 hypothetical protein OLW01_09295 [Catenovulum sp. TS8]
MKTAYIGKNSKVYQLLKNAIFRTGDIEVSYRDDFELLVKNDIVQAVVFSWSKKLEDNIALFVRLNRSGIKKVYFLSTSATCFESCHRYGYVKNKLIVEQFVVSNFDLFYIVKAGLIENTHDLGKIHGSVPYTSLDGLACSINEWKKLSSIEDSKEIKLFKVDCLTSQSLKLLLLYRIYKLSSYLPFFISRPLDIVFKLLGYNNYGYLFRQFN